MNAKNILSLYNGEYTFIEKSVTKNPKYSKALNNCLTLEEKIQKLVTPEVFSIYEESIEAHTILSGIEMENAFVEGFSLGVSLILESVSDKN